MTPQKSAKPILILKIQSQIFKFVTTHYHLSNKMHFLIKVR